MEKELEEEDLKERESNQRMLEEIQKHQEGRDDRVDELLAFANRQLDMIEKLEEELKQNLKDSDS